MGTRDYPLERVRNFGIIAHNDARLRTSRFSTLADSLLSSAGKLPFPRPPSRINVNVVT